MKRNLLIVVLVLIIAGLIYWKKEDRQVASDLIEKAPAEPAAPPAEKSEPAPKPTPVKRRVAEPEIETVDEGEKPLSRKEQFAYHRKEIGDAVEIEGTATISVGDQKAEFSVQLLLPNAEARGAHSFAIAMDSATDSKPDLAAMGMGGLLKGLVHRDPLAIQVPASWIHSFFAKPDEREVRDFTMLGFTIDRRVKKGVSAVYARYNYEVDTPTTTIGQLKYRIVETPTL